MPEPSGYDDEAYYRAVLESLTADWGWQRQPSSPSVDAAAAYAADNRLGEVFLDHCYTDATLSISVPHPSKEYAARLLLDHPLDDRLPNEQDGFIGDLRRSQAKIVGRYENEYLDAIVDTSLVCRARIPVEYSQDLIYATMLAISASALRIQRLHDEVETPVARAFDHR